MYQKNVNLFNDVVTWFTLLPYYPKNWLPLIAYKTFLSCLRALAPAS